MRTLMIFRFFFVWMPFLFILLIQCDQSFSIPAGTVKEHSNLKNYFKKYNQNQEWETDFFRLKRIENTNGFRYQLISKVYNRTIWEFDSKHSFLIFLSDEPERLICANQILDFVDQEKHFFYIRGNHICEDHSRVSYQLFFIQQNSNHIKIKIRCFDKRIQKTIFVVPISDKEIFFGMGTQKNVLPSEKSRYINIASEGSIRLPFWFSNNYRGLYLTNWEKSIFNFFKKKNLIEVFSPQIKGGFMIGDGWKSIIKTRNLVFGKMLSLPQWVHNGIILDVHGGGKNIEELLNQLKFHHIKVSSIIVRDWTGPIKNSEPVYNWSWNVKLYPHPEAWIQKLNQRNIKVIVLLSPFLEDTVQFSRIENSLYQYAIKNDFFIQDQKQNYITIKKNGKVLYPLDITNYDVREWMENIIKKNIIKMGVKGWILILPRLPEESLPSNWNIAIYQNQFPSDMAQLNWESIYPYKPNSFLLASDSGFMDTSRYINLFWFRDFSYDWEGLKKSISVLLSSGISGYPYVHFLIRERDSRQSQQNSELLIRWLQFATFSPVFRIHKDTISHIFQDKKLLNIFNKFYFIYQYLYPYRKELMKQVNQYGYPLLRPIWFHFSELSKKSEGVLLGDELFIFPITESRVIEKNIFLPEGEWINIWTGKRYQGNQKIRIAISLDTIPVFYLAKGRWSSFFRKLGKNLQYGLFP